MSPSRTPKARLAHQAVALAIKSSELFRQPCEVCLYQRIFRLGWPVALALSLKPSLSYVSKPDKHTYSCGGVMSCRAARESAFRFQRSSPRKANPEKQAA